MILGIKKDRLILTDKNREELMSIPYIHIASWGVSSQVFVIVVQKTEYELKKIYLSCFNTKIIQLLITAYTSLLSGLGISDVIYKVYDSIKMFESMSKVKMNPGESLRSKQCTVFKKFLFK